MRPLCPHRKTLRRCFLLHACLLLCLLCFCAHVCMELKGLCLKGWMTADGLQKQTLDRRNQTLDRRNHKSVNRTKHAATDVSVGSRSTPQKHHRPAPRWRIDLEPWAADSHGLQEEAQRFLSYISTPQVSCEGSSVRDREDHGPWALCLDSRFSLARRIAEKQCRVYSFRLGSEDSDALERSLSSSGCDVHCFDPGLSSAHLQDGHMWLHRLSLDWREPNPGVLPHRSTSKKLQAILNHFGHTQVDVLKLDLEAAEWKLLENLLLERVLASVGLVLLELHLHWAGFEVDGDEPTVLRYWFSLMRELERAHFQLYHSYRDPRKPRLVLHRDIPNGHSAFILGWVNTRFSPRD